MHFKFAPMGLLLAMAFDDDNGATSRLWRSLALVRIINSINVNF